MNKLSQRELSLSAALFPISIKSGSIGRISGNPKLNRVCAVR